MNDTTRPNVVYIYVDDELVAMYSLPVRPTGVVALRGLAEGAPLSAWEMSLSEEEPKS